MQHAEEHQQLMGKADSKEFLVVDIGCSMQFAQSRLGCAPCLTAARCSNTNGYYITGLERAMSRQDILRCMGIPVSFYRASRAKVTRGKFGHMLGNAVPCNLWMRIIPRAMKAAGMVSPQAHVPDYWCELLAWARARGLTTPV